MIFKHPSFLWALLVLLIPIIIHLFNFRRYKKVMFSNVEMLKSIETESRKSRQLKKVLVLLARLLALTALVFAFAQPFIPQQTETKGIRLNSIYLDNSYSMNAEGENGQLFESAKNAARSLVDAFPPGSSFQIIDNDNRSFSARVLTRDKAIKTIDDIELSRKPNQLNLAGDAAKRALASTSFQGQNIFLISDFQKNGLSSMQSFDSNTQVNILRLEAQKDNNVSIDSVWLDAPINKPDAPIMLSVRVSNYGAEDVSSVNLVLKINNVQQGAESFELQGKSSKDLKLSFTTPETGWIEGQLSLNDYPVVFDNDYYFAIRLKAKMTVLAIGRTNQNYLDRIFANDPDFDYSMREEYEVEYAKLKDADFVILNQLSSVSSGLAQELKKFTEKGGVLLIIPSTQIKDYQNLSLDLGIPAYGAVSTKNLSVSLDDLRHPLFETVYKELPKNSFLPSITKMYQIGGGTAIGFRKVLGLKDGSVAVGGMKKGAGQIYQMAFPLDESWSSFPKHELFVSSLLRMAFSKEVKDRIAFDLGQEAAISINIEASEEGLVLTKDKKEVIVETSTASGDLKLWLNDEVNEVGIYDVKYKEDSTIRAKVALNGNRMESEQAFYNNEEIQELYEGSEVNFLSESTASLKEAASKAANGIQLWKQFIILSLIFLVLEILLLRFLKS